jgi:hypothetical protein
MADDDDTAAVELGNNARGRVMKKMRQFTQRTRGESGEKINLLMKRFSAARQLAEQQAQLRRTGQNNDDPNGSDQSRESKEVKSEGAVTGTFVVSTGNDDGKRELAQSVQLWGKFGESMLLCSSPLLVLTCFFGPPRTVHNANALIHSREMSSLVCSSRDVALDVTGLVMHGAGMAVYIAFLPVTVPLHVVGSATNLIVGTCSHVAFSSLLLVQNVLSPSDSNSSTADNDEDGTAVVVATSSPIDGLVHTVLGTADHVKNEIGGILLGFVLPIFGGEQPSSEEEEGSYLDRLRLEEQQGVTASDVTKFLLRVEDLNLFTKGGQPLVYIDLCPDFQDEQLSSRAIDALVADGLALVSIGLQMTGELPSRQMANSKSNKFDGFIDWKAEGATKKLLKQKGNLPASDWNTLMETELLVWSGTFNAAASGNLSFRNDAGIYLSRGLIPGSPRAIFDLLWDNSRTKDYNKFCLGRSDALVISEEDADETFIDGEPSSDGKKTVSDDEPSSDRQKSLKIIKVLKGESRVPLTSLSVVISTLIHGAKLEDYEDDGDSTETYLIVRRSLTSGGAGFHSEDGRHRVERGGSQNEITWSVNLLRSVPAKPGTTDMITLSQICSSMVPRFLTHRVGMTGTDNFFSSLRSREVSPEQC